MSAPMSRQPREVRRNAPSPRKMARRLSRSSNCPCTSLIPSSSNALALQFALPVKDETHDPVLEILVGFDEIQVAEEPADGAFLLGLGEEHLGFAPYFRLPVKELEG